MGSAAAFFLVTSGVCLALNDAVACDAPEKTVAALARRGNALRKQAAALASPVPAETDDEVRALRQRALLCFEQALAAARENPTPIYAIRAALYQDLGRPVAEAADLQRYLADPAATANRPAVQQRFDALHRQVGWVELRAPAGCALFIDNAPVGSAPLPYPVPVEPGPRLAALEGCPKASTPHRLGRPFSALAGVPTVVDLADLLRPPPEPPRDPQSPRPPPPPPPKVQYRSRPHLGMIIAGSSLFLGSFVPSLAVGLARPELPSLRYPLLGPFLALREVGNASGALSSEWLTALLTVAGVQQGLGLVLTIYGLSSWRRVPVDSGR